MAAFVLVHGAWHGGWCFEKLAPALEALGHHVLAPDLPGHGSDATPPREVTLASCVARVGDTLARASEPAVLLGHSMGGVIISQAGEEHAPRVRALVYLAAFLPASGEGLASFRAASAVSDLLRTDREAGLVHLDASGARHAFYHDCEDADVRAACSRLRPQPIGPWTARVALGPRFAALPRHYVECTEDRAIPLELQRSMHAATPCRVHTLESSHSPFYAMPERLAALLDAIVHGQARQG